MASQEPKPDLVDLLYDDELDEESRQAIQSEVDASDEQRQELEDFEQMLGAIRQADLDEEPSASVHESIMAAAREHAAEATSRKAQVTRRAPTSASSERGLWSRVRSSSVGQFVLTASVVLLAGVVFMQLAGDEAEQKFHSANSATGSEVSFGEREPTKVAEAPAVPVEEASEPAELVDELEEGDAAEFAGAERAEQDARGRSEAVSVKDKESDIGEVAQLDQSARKAKVKKKRALPKRRARRSRSRSRKKSSDEDVLDLWNGPSKSDSRTKSNEPAMEVDRRDSEAAEESVASTDSDESGISDVADLGSYTGDSIAEESASEPQPSAAAASAPEAKAPAGQREADDDEQSQHSVSAMETRYRSGNYAGVVTQANRYLARSSGDKADEARVLELKARALAQQGKTGEADRTYTELQKKYPAYKSDQVERERKELAEKRRKRRRKRQPVEQEEARDMEFDMNDSDQAGDAAPSSIEAY